MKNVNNKSYKKERRQKMDEGHQYMIMALMIGAAISFSVAMDRQNYKELEKNNICCIRKM